MGKLHPSGGHYLIRLDDIAPNMNWDAYERAKTLFVKYSVKPLIGVIPDNQDPTLLRFPGKPEIFWDEVRNVQKLGWEIAIHGYQHLYDSGGANYFGVRGPSEFANHSEEEQFRKLKLGLDIFKREGIHTDVFFAPSHTFDANTIKALKRLGVNCISDGYNLYPHNRDGILFVPQMLGRAIAFPFGLHTSVHHLNEFREADFRVLESFVQKHHERIISFKDAKALTNNGILASLVGKCVHKILTAKRGLQPSGG